MATTPIVSKPPSQPDMDDLMRQAERSTANLGWLQDYLQTWQTLRSCTIRLYTMQQQQKTWDMSAYDTLRQMDMLALEKIDTLQEAYNKMLERHERLMRRVLEGR